MLQWSAAGLLTAGFWPGALGAEGDSPAEDFRFLVVNDIHYVDDKCGAFLERVVQQMKGHDSIELCLIAGDLTHHGRAAQFGAVKEIFSGLGAPVYVVPGNHDYLSQNDRAPYDELFPGRLNYHFEHRGWTFVALDSTEGLRAANTFVQEPTLRWLDEALPKIDHRRPTILFTHFPLGEKVRNRPRNADAVLERFREFNLKGVFGGHFHGITERTAGQTVLVTDRCCSISQPNHDKSIEKGYFLCEARDGRVFHTFVEVNTGVAGPAPVNPPAEKEKPSAAAGAQTALSASWP